jgi:hypothetical protein
LGDVLREHPSHHDRCCSPAGDRLRRLALGLAQIPYDALLPVHWGSSGKADRLAGKAEALSTLPIAIVMIATLLIVLPRIVPDRERLADSSRGYNIVAVGVLALLTCMHAASVIDTVAGGVPFTRLVAAAP